MLIFPEPENTAIFLHALEEVATDLIFVPVKSSPDVGLNNFPNTL